MYNFTSRMVVKAKHIDDSLSQFPQGRRSDLTAADILPNAQDASYIKEKMVDFTFSTAITNFEPLKKYDKLRVLPKHVNPVTKSEVVPLPLLDLDEKYKDSNIQILKTFAKELSLTPGNCPDQLIVGDQASCRTARGAKRWRQSELDNVERLSWAKETPGDFHFLWECLRVIFIVCWGTPREHGSLCHLREVIHRNNTDKDGKTFKANDEFLEHATDAYFIAALTNHLKLVDMTTLSSEQLRDHTRQFVELFLLGQPTSPGEKDEVYEMSKCFLQLGFYYNLLRMSIRYEDGPMVVRMWRVWFVLFLGTTRSNYSCEAANLLANLKADWSEYVAHLHTHNRTVNMTGRPGKGKAIDMLLEHYNKIVKSVCKPSGGQLTVNHAQEISVAVKLFDEAIKFCVDTFDTRKTSNHTARSANGDISTMVKELLNGNIFEELPGRKLHGGKVFLDPFKRGSKRITVDSWLETFLRKTPGIIETEQTATDDMANDFHEDLFYNM